MSRPPSMSYRHSTPSDVRQASTIGADFTNVTALSWPEVPVHPRYDEARGDYRRLKADLQDDLARCSYETLARVTWLLGAIASSDK